MAMLRSFLDSLTLNQEQSDVFIGSMLGDAYLGCTNKAKWNWSFHKTQSKYDKNLIDKITYMNWHFDVFHNISRSLIGDIFKPKISNSTHKKSEYYRYTYRTIPHLIFTQLAKKWYRNNGNGNWEKKTNRIIKIIPNDIKLSPLSLCVWLMDDGFCYPKDANAMLCTHCFTVDEVNFLVDRLQQDLNIKSRLRMVKQKWKGVESEKPVIYIGRKSYFDMIDMIKPHVKWDCFQYKIDTTTYNKIVHRGETHATSVLTEEQVRHIFDLKKQGMFYRDIAKTMGVSDSNIALIINGKRWGHLGLGDLTPSIRKKPHFNLEAINKVIQLNAEGFSKEFIAKELTMSKTTVGRIIKRNSHAANRTSICPIIPTESAL